MKALLAAVATVILSAAPVLADADYLFKLKKEIVWDKVPLATQYNRRIFQGDGMGFMEFRQENPSATVKTYVHSNIEKPYVSVEGSGRLWGICHAYFHHVGEGLKGSDIVCVAVNKDGKALDPRMDSKAYRLKADRYATKSR